MINERKITAEEAQLWLAGLEKPCPCITEFPEVCSDCFENASVGLAHDDKNNRLFLSNRLFLCIGKYTFTVEGGYNDNAWKPGTRRMPSRMH